LSKLRRTRCEPSRVAFCYCRMLPRALALCALLTCAAAAEPPRRVVSINLCTDQLLIALADRAQVAAVSYNARDPELSFLAREAASYPIIGGSGEEVLKLAPDLVLAGAFTRQVTRELLLRQGLRVETFMPVLTIADVRAEIGRIAALLGHPDRGAALEAEISRALAEIGPAPARPLTALQFQRRGYASGRETLVSELMARVGLANAAERLGIASVERVPLEAVLKAAPDVLVLDDERAQADDQGAALLQHPALAASVPAARRIVVPLRETVCGGPALPAAIRTLSREVARVRGLMR
jgi:iron complex transport system substrate-binding protein